MTSTSVTPLQAPFTFWYMRRGKGVSKSQAGAEAEEKDPATPSTPSNPYESSIKQIATVRSVEEFWGVYDFLVRPNDLPTTTDYHFFREGVKPTWEDAANARGGKWIVRLRKGLASRYWEEVILALIGCQFTGIPSNEVCGAVVSIRYSEDIVSVWNKTNDREITERLRDGIKRVLQLPTFVHMEYKPHETSLQDKSSLGIRRFGNLKIEVKETEVEGIVMEMLQLEDQHHGLIVMKCAVLRARVMIG
eukprot:876765_1